MNINGAGGSSSDYSRITGLATGMDTEGMVQKAIAGDKVRINSVKQDRQMLQWKQEAYVDVIKDLKDFYNSYLDILAPNATGMMTSGTYSGLKAESADPAKISAFAYGGAIKGNYEITVSKLAEGARLQGVSPKSDATLSTTLSSLGISSGNISITVNGKNFDVTVDSSKSISDFLNAVRSGKNGKDVLGDYIDINYSELTKKLTIETKETGISQKLNINDNGIGLVSKFGMNNSDDGEDADVYIKAPGETSAIKVDSKIINKNKFVIDNIQYDVSGAEIGKAVNITVKPDATDKVEKFKKFIEKYNSVVESINKKISEKKEYKYKALTDEQKKDMKEEEIKKWEDKTKQGILAREHNLSNLLMQVREIFYSKVEGVGLNAQEIGIETTSNWRDGGKLKLNEEKLKAALETRGDQVQKLFTQKSDVNGQKGMLQRIRESLDKYIGSDGILIKKAGYENSRWLGSNDLSKSIEKKNIAIKELENKMYKKQERYYRMFAALEQNMNRLNSQSNWLASQLGSR